MKNSLVIMLSLSSLLCVSPSGLSASLYGEILCKKSHYYCLSITRKDSWSSLFPDETKRNLVKRINRMNGFLQPKMVLAVPRSFSKEDIAATSPFPSFNVSIQEKKIMVNLSMLAWGAYDAHGKLVKWGAISPGTKECFDSAGCSTPKGKFRAISKQGGQCESHTYPVRMNGVKGGGEMPFCIFFYKGYALHGSSELPGYPASAGCVRLFIEDAQWLNEQFVELPSVYQAGTLIEIL